MNCQIRGLTSIRKGLGKDHIPFLVDTNSIIASENVSGRELVENQGRLRKANFTKPEGSQSGGVKIFPDSEGSQSGGVSILLIRTGPIFANLEGYCLLSTRRGIIFV